MEWKPYPDYAPSCAKTYLVTYKHPHRGGMHVVSFCRWDQIGDKGKFRWIRRGCAQTSTIIAWSSLPLPYQECYWMPK